MLILKKNILHQKTPFHKLSKHKNDSKTDLVHFKTLTSNFKLKIQFSHKNFEPVLLCYYPILYPIKYKNNNQLIQITRNFKDKSGT